MEFRAPEGTHDILPEEIWKGRRLEEAARACFDRYGYEEIRTPIFERAALYLKSSGETSDLVQKEMFTFGDPGEEGAFFALRPELTPGVIRALVGANLFRRRGFWKLWYLGPAFRRERPQKGRYRQFTQLGVEAVGSSDPLVDAETMILFAELLRDVGVKSWDLRINTLGCGACRGRYREILRRAVEPDLPGYCEDCRRRFARNVFRVLDCKVPGCVERAGRLPAAVDHVCGPCRQHLETVLRALREAEIPHRVDPRIVRGLDYYTRTVYEFGSPALGAQDALCGGGRYDTLVRDMGGPDVGSVGFAAGVERMLLAMEAKAPEPSLDFFGVAVTAEQRPALFRLVTELRRAGFRGDMDFEGRSLKAQMREAHRSGARRVLLLGPEEVRRGKVRIKEMKEGTEFEAAPGEIPAILGGGRA